MNENLEYLNNAMGSEILNIIVKYYFLYKNVNISIIKLFSWCEIRMNIVSVLIFFFSSMTLMIFIYGNISFDHNTIIMSLTFALLLSQQVFNRIYFEYIYC